MHADDELVLVLTRQQIGHLSIAAAIGCMTDLVPKEMLPDIAEAVGQLAAAIGSDPGDGYADTIKTLRKVLKEPSHDA